MIVAPRLPGLAVVLKHTHGRYAGYWNASHTSSGHVWQGRYYSCPLDSYHLWAALRYTELNPVRAHLVDQPETYAWSSAAAHCGTGEPDVALAMDFWQKHWNAGSWREYLLADGAEADAEAIRQSTHTGRPLGTPEFIEALEKAMQRQLLPKKGGRPTKAMPDAKQESLAFD